MQNRMSKRFFLSLVASAIAGSVLAVPAVDVVAPASRVNLFLSANTSAIQSGAYISPAPTHSIFGSMGFLNPSARSSTSASDTTTVQQKLQNTLDMTGMKLAPNKLGYMAIDESAAGERYQCVAFAKAMTSIGVATTSWLRGSALVSGTTYTPGTMIGHFAGQTVYSKSGVPHVAIILSTAYDPTTKSFIGYNVVDQNAVNTVSTGPVGSSSIGGGGGDIAKHFLPWSSSSGQSVLSAKNYHVIQKCPIGKTCP